MPSCPRCGALQAERTAFCSACGALIDRPDTASSADSPRQPTAAPDPPLEQRRPPIVEHEFGDIGVYIARRFFALVLDLAGIGFLLGIGLIAFVDSSQAQPDQFLALHARDFALALGGSILLYLALSEALFGSTIGKGLFGLGVGRIGGGRLGFGRALIRNVLLPLDLAVIGFIVATVTTRRRRIGDLVAGSVVANARMGIASTVAAVVVGVAAAWALFSVADGARMSSQLIALASLRTPVEQITPLPKPSVDHVRQLPVETIKPSPAPSADPGRPPPG